MSAVPEGNEKKRKAVQILGESVVAGLKAGKVLGEYTMTTKQKEEMEKETAIEFDLERMKRYTIPCTYFTFNILESTGVAIFHCFPSLFSNRILHSILYLPLPRFILLCYAAPVKGKANVKSLKLTGITVLYTMPWRRIYDDYKTIL